MKLIMTAIPLKNFMIQFKDMIKLITSMLKGIFFIYLQHFFKIKFINSFWKYFFFNRKSITSMKGLDHKLIPIN